MNALAAIVVGGLGIGQLAIYVVICAAVIALMYVALQQFGIAIPEWVKNCFWIIVVTFVIVYCIKFVISM